ncbi:MAG: helix-turn-helix domain-containing protein [Geminicoccaceae bacterium]
MAGTRQFDESQVLDAMMRVFWEKGFEGTSIDDLVRATGLQRGSLYNAFGDKAAMFCRALRLYQDEVHASHLHALRGDDPREALTRLFQLKLKSARDGGQPQGCMLSDARRICHRLPTNAATETKAAAGELEEALFAMFERARAAGRLAATADCRALARFYAAVARGVTGTDPEPLEDIARIGVALLEAA